MEWLVSLSLARRQEAEMRIVLGCLGFSSPFFLLARRLMHVCSQGRKEEKNRVVIFASQWDDFVL